MDLCGKILTIIYIVNMYEPALLLALVTVLVRSSGIGALLPLD